MLFARQRLSLALLVFLVAASTAGAETLMVSSLSSAPAVDGVGDDWGQTPVTTVPVAGPLAVKTVDLRVGVHGDSVYFLLRWADPQADEVHKPYVWDAGSGRYVAGPQREDRLAIQFLMEGTYDTNWLSGHTFKADTWHWKAGRSNPSGLAHDKMTIIGRVPVKKAYKAKSSAGQDIYIQRPSDAGDTLYTTQRYRTREKDVMPKYIVTPSPTGSVADVRAAGVWNAGYWTLELRRKRNTGHPDDRVFAAGQAVPGGIAVFERSGDDQHNVSPTLVFQF